MNPKSIAVLTALAATSLAAADTVDVAFSGVGLGRTVTTDFRGRVLTHFAGQLTHDYRNGTGSLAGMNGTYLSFCTEIGEYVSRTEAEFTKIDLADGPSSDPMGIVRAEAIDNIFAFASGRQFTDVASGDNRDFAAAFQLAVWEIATDYDGSIASLDLTGGDFGASGAFGNSFSSGMSNHLDDIFGVVGSGSFAGSDAFILSHAGNQDQVMSAVVPLPAPVALGVAGLGMVMAYKRRRRTAGIETSTD